MKTIYKYNLSCEDITQLRVPSDFQVLSVQEQRGELCIWALVDNDRVKDIRVFHVYGTGDKFEASDMIHIGTVQMGVLVWHVFDLGWR